MSINGVDTQSLFATIAAVKGQPELARFQFRVRNRWVSGTHNRTTINGYYGAGQEFTRAADHRYDADHPPVLTGTDEGPTPVEFLLHALAACLTSGLANIAAARGIPLTEVTSTVEGDIDLRGILGLDPGVRNGFQGIRVNFAVRGEGTPEQLQGLVAQSRARSAVFDMLTNGVPVTVEAKVG
jgi:uncharacterized OsmC-like protein